MRDLIRGEYDDRKVAGLRAFAARLGRKMLPPRDPDDIDPERVPMDATRATLIAIVILLAAVAFSLLSVPVAAFAERTLHALNTRLDSDVTGKVVLPQIAQRSVVLARDGSVIDVLKGDQNRKIISLAEVPPVAQQAVLAIEDARFYEHHGLDVFGVLRAAFTNTAAGGLKQGGSTITQQLVKNTLTKGERTINRKLKEAQLAIQLERQVPKQRILELYLNEAYFGNGVYGIGTAAEFYFGKPAKDLTLSHAALLAGLVSSPENYDPLAHPDVARQRRAVVLQRMVEVGDVTQAQAHAASTAPLDTKPHALSKTKEPYFVEYVKQQILSDPTFGATREARIRALFEGGLRIETTLDLKLEAAGKKAVSDVLNLKDDPSAALVSIDPETGGVRAMVGGNDYSRAGAFNLAVQGVRQPGSTFKPFALVAALDSGLAPTYTLDTPSPIKLTDPGSGQVNEFSNYDKRGEGYITMRRATELSVNTYYLQLALKVGLQKVADTAKRMGITEPLRPYLSIPLGTQEVSPYHMASAYSTLANQGIHCEPYGITRVTDGVGNVIVKNDPKCDRVVDSSVAAQATDILVGGIERGTGKRAKLDRPAAGKTGTTEEVSDAWFAGYTPQFATVVWIGFKEGNARPLLNIHGFPKVFGGTLPAEIWKRYMVEAHKGLPVVQFPKPPKVPQVVVPSVVGLAIDIASKTLEEAGFTVKIDTVRSSLPAGTVVVEGPTGGSKVDPGVLIHLIVSDGKGAPAASPSPSPSPTPTPSHPPSPTPSPSKTPSASPSPSPSPSKSH